MFNTKGTSLQILSVYNTAADISKNNALRVTASITEPTRQAFSTRVVDLDDPIFVYAVCRAVTADCPNKNGDMFTSAELKRAYTSFVGCNLFLDHKTTSVRDAVGKVVAAEYIENDPNSEHPYVATLIKIDAVNRPDIASMVKTGTIDSVSMGASVQESTCSVCGNTASRKEDFCIHLQPQNIGRIDNETGKVCCSINSGVEFTELSLVSVPADPTARMHQVFAEAKDNMKVTAAPAEELQATQLTQPDQVPAEEQTLDTNTQDMPGVSSTQPEQTTGDDKTVEAEDMVEGYNFICKSDDVATALVNIFNEYKGAGVLNIAQKAKEVNVSFNSDIVKNKEEFIKGIFDKNKDFTLELKNSNQVVDSNEEGSTKEDLKQSTEGQNTVTSAASATEAVINVTANNKEKEINPMDKVKVTASEEENLKKNPAEEANKDKEAENKTEVKAAAAPADGEDKKDEKPAKEPADNPAEKKDEKPAEKPADGKKAEDFMKEAEEALKKAKEAAEKDGNTEVAKQADEAQKALGNNNGPVVTEPNIPGEVPGDIPGETPADKPLEMNEDADLPDLPELQEPPTDKPAFEKKSEMGAPVENIAPEACGCNKKADVKLDTTPKEDTLNMNEMCAELKPSMEANASVADSMWVISRKADFATVMSFPVKAAFGADIANDKDRLAYATSAAFGDAVLKKLASGTIKTEADAQVAVLQTAAHYTPSHASVNEYKDNKESTHAKASDKIETKVMPEIAESKEAKAAGELKPAKGGEQGNTLEENKTDNAVPMVSNTADNRSEKVSTDLEESGHAKNTTKIEDGVYKAMAALEDKIKAQAAEIAEKNQVIANLNARIAFNIKANEVKEVINLMASKGMIARDEAVFNEALGRGLSLKAAHQEAMKAAVTAQQKELLQLNTGALQAFASSISKLNVTASQEISKPAVDKPFKVQASAETNDISAERMKYLESVLDFSKK